MIYKSTKVRCPKHLKFVRSHACCITRDGDNCNGTPVDPHHLMKIGGRGTSLKESDEWTVPLCRKHHTEVTGYGDEEVFWVFYGIPYETVIKLAQSLASRSPSEAIRNTLRRNNERNTSGL